MRKAVIFDIDGTVADINHRLPFIKQPKKDWNAFYESSVVDPVIEPMKDLLLSVFHEDYKIIFVTGRPEKIRDITVGWINRELKVHSYLLYMRKDNDYRKDAVIKEEIYQEHIRDDYDVRFVVEDRKQCVDMWRDQGLVCLQCAEGNF